VKLHRLFGHEILLGSLVAVLSVLTALVSYQGSMSDSKQNQHELLGMTQLNDGNAENLEANQFIVYDYTMYDGWYTTTDEEKSAYYVENYSEELQEDLGANPGDPFSDSYYEAMYATSEEYWTDSDTNFDLAAQYDERGDRLQLVMLLMALGLAFAAWAALMRAEGNLRRLFGLFSTIMLAVGLVSYVLTLTI
jgi:hypothetical protein